MQTTRWGLTAFPSLRYQPYPVVFEIEAVHSQHPDSRIATLLQNRSGSLSSPNLMSPVYHNALCLTLPSSLNQISEVDLDVASLCDDSTFVPCSASPHYSIFTVPLPGINATCSFQEANGFE